MTCKLLMGNRGAELLTSYLVAFLAKTLVLPEKVLGLTENAAECGTTWRGSLGKYDPATHSLKTAQHSLFADLTECSPILPRSGLMHDGECWELPTLAHHTSGRGSGLWQTPVADDCVNREKGKWNSRGEPKLSAQVLQWPTPTVCGNYNRKGASASSGDGIATAVHQRTYPTATATSYKGWSPNHNRADTDDRLDYTIEREGFRPGQQTPPMRLNPDWVEWLMGWPIEHTALKPLATARYREWQRQHSLYSPEDRAAA
jgi:hypothetical protein